MLSAYLMNSITLERLRRREVFPVGCSRFALVAKKESRLSLLTRQLGRPLPGLALTSTARSWPVFTHRSTVSRETVNQSAICWMESHSSAVCRVRLG